MARLSRRRELTRVAHGPGRQLAGRLSFALRSACVQPDMPSYSQLSSDDENVSPAPQRRGGGAAKKAGGRRPPTPGSATPDDDGSPGGGDPAAMVQQLMQALNASKAKKDTKGDKKIAERIEAEYHRKREAVFTELDAEITQLDEKLAADLSKAQAPVDKEVGKLKEAVKDHKKRADALEKAVSALEKKVEGTKRQRDDDRRKAAADAESIVQGFRDECETIRKRAKRQLGDVQTAKHGSAPMQQLLQVAATIAAQVEGAADDDSQLA